MKSKLNRLNKDELFYRVMLACADYCEISVKNLKSKRRDRVFSDCRKVAINVFKELRPQVTTSVIGAMMNRDHTTVIYCIKAHKKLILVDNNYNDFYQHIKHIFEDDCESKHKTPIRYSDILKKYKEICGKYEKLKTQYFTVQNKYDKIKQLIN